jgi:probable F420-dependent oxidoreductase
MKVELGRIGVWVSRRHLDSRSETELGDFAAELADAGYGALWVGAVKATLAPAAAVLGATTRLAFATGIVNVWTEPVADVVAAYHRLNAVYANRLLLGIGAGHREATPEYQRPYERVNEYLDALAAAATPVPAEHTALAALGPHMLWLAGQRTAGAHPYLVTPEHTRRAREILGTNPLLAPEQKVVLETDASRAREIARNRVGFYLGLANYVANLRRLGFTDADFAANGSNRLIDALVAWGEPEAIAARIAEHHAAGADHVCIQVLAPHGDGLPRDQLRVLGPVLTGL